MSAQLRVHGSGVWGQASQLCARGRMGFELSLRAFLEALIRYPWSPDRSLYAIILGMLSKIILACSRYEALL